MFPDLADDIVLNRRLAVLILASCLTAVHAQDEAEGQDAGGFLQAPEVVPSPVTGEAVEPDITIRESGGEIFYEYRVRGVLYMVRVQPPFGPPYYLYDLNGDGLIDAQERAAHNISVPQWVLFDWR
ncbi:DUF2782 domain-containing protein [Thermochromatium tepidum ATCC 43061]|uniref:DUF2782 domain-containing protein n=1 Tax=Thermochromatium tepidum ATCC 43061 TaxID=316276 RepID=A0A6I6ECL4_THETI|nr:DUF2782 domain-containing protein [Thermochromatium tepidum ATCC 43061]